MGDLVATNRLKVVLDHARWTEAEPPCVARIDVDLVAVLPAVDLVTGAKVDDVGDDLDQVTASLARLIARVVQRVAPDVFG